jgi:hypothetical protein
MKNKKKERPPGLFMAGWSRRKNARHANIVVQAHTRTSCRDERRDEYTEKRRRKNKKRVKRERNDESFRLSAPLVTQMAPRSHLSCIRSRDRICLCHPSLLCVFLQNINPNLYTSWRSVCPETTHFNWTFVCVCVWLFCRNNHRNPLRFRRDYKVYF